MATETILEPPDPAAEHERRVERSVAAHRERIERDQRRNRRKAVQRAEKSARLQPAAHRQLDELDGLAAEHHDDPALVGLGRFANLARQHATVAGVAQTILHATDMAHGMARTAGRDALDDEVEILGVWKPFLEYVVGNHAEIQDTADVLAEARRFVDVLRDCRHATREDGSADPAGVFYDDAAVHLRHVPEDGEISTYALMNLLQGLLTIGRNAQEARKQPRPKWMEAALAGLEPMTEDERARVALGRALASPHTEITRRMQIETILADLEAQDGPLDEEAKARVLARANLMTAPPPTRGRQAQDRRSWASAPTTAPKLPDAAPANRHGATARTRRTRRVGAGQRGSARSGDSGDGSGDDPSEGADAAVFDLAWKLSARAIPPAEGGER